MGIASDLDALLEALDRADAAVRAVSSVSRCEPRDD
jgi:hypothetical protein